MTPCELPTSVYLVAALARAGMLSAQYLRSQVRTWLTAEGTRQVTSRTALVTLAALEAASVLLGLMACPACPRALIQAEHLEAACQLVKTQLQVNLLSFCNATLRRECRDDWESMPPVARCGHTDLARFLVMTGVPADSGMGISNSHGTLTNRLRARTN